MKSLKDKIENNSPQLVLIPGWGFESSVFNSIEVELNKKFRVIAIDLPGIANINLGNNDRISVIIKYIDIITPNNSILLGWSLGGLLATCLGYMNPKKYLAIITAASSPKFIADNDWPGISKKQRDGFYDLLKNYPRKFYKYFLSLVCFPGKAKQLLKKLSAGFENTQENNEKLLFYLDLLFNTDVRHYLQEIHIPTLHLFGGNDAIVPIITAKKMKNIINIRHRIKIIKGAGHGLFLSHQNIFTNIVDQFVCEELA